VFVETPIGKVLVRTADQRSQFTLAIRPEKILMTNGATPNQFTGEVIETTYTGADTHGVVRIGHETVRVVLVNHEAVSRLIPGATIHLTLPPEALVILED
jgi:ABC-type Fe3+/spermidine/putrescine transport system ATPase subunit